MISSNDSASAVDDSYRVDDSARLLVQPEDIAVEERSYRDKSQILIVDDEPMNIEVL